MNQHPNRELAASASDKETLKSTSSNVKKQIDVGSKQHDIELYAAYCPLSRHLKCYGQAQPTGRTLPIKAL